MNPSATCASALLQPVQADLARLAENVARFAAGTLSPTEFRAFRVPMGVYEERTGGLFMLRVRLTAGQILPRQLGGLARAATSYGAETLHVTTRQDIQIHRVPLENIHGALVELALVGLSTKGGGGNTVRNVTACEDAGVCPRELFDVSPHARTVADHLLADPLSYQLPRKYKIAFSGCEADCVGAIINDLGFIARTRGSDNGFAVYVGGGMGSQSRVGELLEEFVPAAEVPLVAEAVKRVFDRYGNRRDRRRARLRFLVAEFGLARFRDLYRAERAQVKGAAIAEALPRAEAAARTGTRTAPNAKDACVPDPAAGREETGTLAAPADSSYPANFDRWLQRNTAPQKQTGYRIVYLPLPLGDIRASVLAGLEEVLEARKVAFLRASQWQNLVIPWVKEGELAGLFAELSALGLAAAPPAFIRNTISCAGAATCKLGICLSRGAARAIVDRLQREQLDLDGLGNGKLHISGCPNSCGRHPIGQIGLFGAARRVDQRLVPHYIVQLGGRLGEGRTRLAEGNWIVPARNVPDFVVDFLSAYEDSGLAPDFDRFLEQGGRAVADELEGKYRRVPAFEDDKNPYFDWGSETTFSLAGRGPGECGAGVFDLIEVDLSSAREALAAGRPADAVVLAGRALLVTQGLEAADSLDSLALFRRHFLDAGLVDSGHRSVVGQAERMLARGRDRVVSSIAAVDPAQAAALVEAVQALYDSMDSSLRFQTAQTWPSTHAGAGTQGTQTAAAGVSGEADRTLDLRGVVCPLNYVKTRMELDRMASGEVLAVLLDSDGARNVPESTQKDGHEVIALSREGDHLRLAIRKA